jgi:hypothetical protein
MNILIILSVHKEIIPNIAININNFMIKFILIYQILNKNEKNLRRRFDSNRKLLEFILTNKVTFSLILHILYEKRIQ